MKRYTVILGALAMFATAAVWAEETAEDQCRRFAVEDSIPAEEMDGYIQQCLADLNMAEKDLSLDLDTLPEDAPIEESSDNNE